MISLPDEIEAQRAVNAFRSQRRSLNQRLQYSVTDLAIKLYAKSIILRASLERVTNQTLIPSDGTVILLNEVEDKIKVEPQVFTEFVRILESDPSWRPLALELARSYLNGKYYMKVEARYS